MKLIFKIDLEKALGKKQISLLIYNRLLKKSLEIDKDYDVVSSVGFYGQHSISINIKGRNKKDLLEIKGELEKELGEWFDKKKYTEKELKKFTFKEKMALLRSRASRTGKHAQLKLVGMIGVKISCDIIGD